MNESIHITERIDQILTFLNSVLAYGFKPENAFTQSDAMVVAMKALASLSQDVQKWEKEHQAEECEACKIHVIDEEPK